MKLNERMAVIVEAPRGNLVNKRQWQLRPLWQLYGGLAVRLVALTRRAINESKDWHSRNTGSLGVLTNYL